MFILHSLGFNKFFVEWSSYRRWALVPSTTIASMLTKDASRPAQLLFQDPASGVMEGLVELHHDILFFLVIVGLVVAYFLIHIILHYGGSRPYLRSTVDHHSDAKAKLQSTRLEVI